MSRPRRLEASFTEYVELVDGLKKTPSPPVQAVEACQVRGIRQLGADLLLRRV